MMIIVFGTYKLHKAANEMVLCPTSDHVPSNHGQWY